MENKLRQVMKQNKISVDKISKDIGVTNATINNWCKAKSLDIKTIYKICNYLELPVSEVFVIDGYISFDKIYDLLNSFENKENSFHKTIDLILNR